MLKSFLLRLFQVIFIFLNNHFEMEFIKTIRLANTFYNNFKVFSVIITTICFSLFWGYGMNAFFMIFWFKVFTMLITFFAINQYKINEYFYYQNLGLSKNKLWIITLCFDFTLFIISLLLIGNLR